MKMYTCTKAFKTTLFDKEPTRIEVEEGFDWFLAKKLKDDRVVLCNNKIELIVANGVLKEHFRQWG